MKTEYNIRDRVWIHIGGPKLTEGRVVEIIDLDHLNEGYDPNRELYVIEISTPIEPLYEVRVAETMSEDERGPIGIYKTLKDGMIAVNQLLGKVGVTTPINSSEVHVEENTGAKKYKKRYNKRKKHFHAQ